MPEPIELMPGEQVIRLVRRHPVFIMTYAVLSLAVIGISLYLIFAVDSAAGLIGFLFELLIAAIGFMAFIFLAISTYRYWYDIWLITSDRIIDSVRRNPFHHHVKVTSLYRIQDTSISKNGIVATLLDFGDVRCRTASEEGDLVLKRVADPTGVMDTVNLAIAEKREREEQEVEHMPRSAH